MNTGIQHADDDEDPTPETPRRKAKADRREALLDAAARLFAERGFAGVSIEDLGAAAGVSGPAVYRHFANKQAVLAALLIDVSEGLLAGGRDCVADAATPRTALESLIAFHVDFALTEPDVIRAQDRDLDSLAAADANRVRTLQRTYVELWVDVLERLRDEDRRSLRVRAHAVFGLINSTPHSSRAHTQSRPPRAVVGALLREMALSCLVP
ncbi:SACE_7040 family transcriptional regulator [Humibacter ginsenosidimutans]|uniref:TetR/AcrR family transcriptional regulator n=1 Tax=Humibacter ginsenosidimutans TaxID=2599293 RepID=A0A5B8M1A5_9MICO|nr:TetR/AcrR family transcriptional regulator [Humibacter ginsenosidimutans]QDZ13492.1 TetR/AcrR family transcriptional regulator [Humibacter ginsenosidimutans]